MKRSYSNRIHAFLSCSLHRVRFLLVLSDLEHGLSLSLVEVSLVLLPVVEVDLELLGRVKRTTRLLVDKVALQDGQRREVEHLQEEGSGEVAHDGADDARDNRLLDVGKSVAGQQPSQPADESADEALADDAHDPANGASGSEGARVSNHHVEGLLGGRAEAGTLDGDLNVSVLGDELDAAVNAPNAASRAAEEASDGTARVTLLKLLGLGGEVLEDDLDQGDDEDEEGAEGERARVISERPSEAGEDRIIVLDLLDVTTLTSEVPVDGGNNGRELLDGSQEEQDPEDAEEEEPEGSGRASSLLNSRQQVGLEVLDLADRVKIDAGSNPPDDDGDHEEVGDQWAEGEALVVAQESGSDLEHGDADRDRAPDAAQADGVDQSEDTGDDGKAESRVLVVRTLGELLVLDEGESSEADTADEQREDAAVEERGHQALQKVQVEHRDEQRTERHTEEDGPGLVQVEHVARHGATGHLIESLDESLAEVLDLLPLGHAEAHNLLSVVQDGVEETTRASTLVLIVEHALDFSIVLLGAFLDADSSGVGRLVFALLGGISEVLNSSPVLELVLREVTLLASVVGGLVLVAETALVTVRVELDEQVLRVARGDGIAGHADHGNDEQEEDAAAEVVSAATLLLIDHALSLTLLGIQFSFATLSFFNISCSWRAHLYSKFEKFKL